MPARTWPLLWAGPQQLRTKNLPRPRNPEQRLPLTTLLKQSESPTGWPVTLASDHGAGLVSAVEGVRRHTQVRNKPQELYLC